MVNTDGYKKGVKRVWIDTLKDIMGTVAMFKDSQKQEQKFRSSLLLQITEVSYYKTELHIKYILFSLKALYKIHPVKKKKKYNKIYKLSKFKDSKCSGSFW